jgi:acetyltransferase-like isoleucine patch superfamily enzyme
MGTGGTRGKKTGVKDVSTAKEGESRFGLATPVRLARRIVPKVGSRLRRWKLRIVYLGEDITLGRRVFLGPGFRLRLQPGGKLVVGDRVAFRQGCTLEVGANASLEIGDETEFTFDVLVQCADEISIGSGCMFANSSSVVDSRHEIASARNGRAQTPLETWSIRVEDGVWVSSKGTLAASVGFGSVIGANSFVSRPIPGGVLAFGTPAKVGRPLGSAVERPPERAPQVARRRFRGSARVEHAEA